MRTPRRLRLLAGLLAVPLLNTACGGDSGDEGDKGKTDGESGGTFSMYISEPEHLIPQNTNESCGSEVLNALFAPLVEYDPETSEIMMGEDADNAVAESIEANEDQTVFTIKLKDGWTFHNGEPVNAAAYARAWNAGAYSPNAYGNSYFFERIEGYADLQAPAAGGKPKAEEMSGLKVVDDTTLEVTLSAPFSQFPLSLGYTAFYPLPEAYTEDPKGFEESPIGNGAFQMDGEWSHNQEINMVRFEEYAGTAAKADAVSFRIYSDINTAYNDLLAGNLDVLDDVPPERIEDAKQQLGDRYLEAPSSSFTYVGFPLYQPEFEDERIRQAISMAIDRDAIIEAIFDGAFEKASSYVSPLVAGARENPCEEKCEYNPEDAKKLYDEAGGIDGPVTLWFNSGAGHEEWMESVSNQLRQNLGIQDINFKSLEFAEYLELLDNEEITGPFRLGWIMDFPSPQNYLEAIYSTTGSSNNFGYSNKEVDRLLQQGNQAGSIEEGIDFYNQAEDLIIEDLPALPMWFGKVQAGHSDVVENVNVDAFEHINTAEITVSQ
jgi:ABC-type transport system substrate-binding protein